MQRISKSNTDENSKKQHSSFKYLVEQRRQSVVSSWSKSDTSTVPGAIDADTMSDSCYLRSRSTSRENSLSGVYDCWFKNDVNLTKPRTQCEQKSSKEVTKVTDIQDKGELNVVEDLFGVVLKGNGTKLMRDIDFPTVIIEIRKQKLQNSMVYYTILEPKSGLYVGEIACLLFTSPYRNKTDATTAELLPLGMILSKSSRVSVTPLLLHEQYRCLFQEGCTFQVKSFKSGRRLDWKQRRWKNYDLESSWIPDLLRRLVQFDISQMPEHMVKQLSPLRTVEHVKKMEKARRRKSFISLMNKSWAQAGTPELKLSLLHPNLQLKGLTARGGSSFAAWFNAIPPYIHVDKEFTCDRNTKLKKDTFKSSSEYDEYLKISDII